MLTLRSGGAVLDLRPEIGGAVGRFAVDGVDVLRPMPPTSRSVLDSASFPLVPFANRIAHGTFSFAGDTIRLPRNFGDHSHALHGQGWQRPWTVASQSGADAVLGFEHPAGDWPWSYAARQHFSLTATALRVSLTLTNTDTRRMPASLGFHPYFVPTPKTVLRTGVAGVWLDDGEGIPTQPAGPAHFGDLGKGLLLAGAPFIDHCHFGWTRTASIEQPELGRVLHLSASSDLSFLHVFAPHGEPFFCVEPVSAMPDALNRAEPPAVNGLHTLEAGESFEVYFEIAVDTRR